MIGLIIGLLMALAAIFYYVLLIRKKLRINQMVLDMSLQLSSTVERRKLLSLIMDAAAKNLDSEASSIILMDHDSGELYFEVATGEDADNIKRIRLPAGQGVAGWVQINGRSTLINDVKSDTRWNSSVSDSSTIKTRNMLCVPIFSNGALLGVLQVINKHRGLRFKKDELLLLEQLSAPIAMSLENMMLYEALRNSMDSLRETTATKERMLSEMRLAKEIQESLLPGQSFKHHHIEIEARLVPAREVGGDFYHFFELDDDHILICLGDVSDKGVSAALFMSTLMIWIKAKSVQSLSVEDIIYSINNELISDDSTMFATLFIGIINTKTGLMQFCDAGHCFIYVINSIIIKKISTIKGLPIGVMSNMKYEVNTYQFSPNDQLILYTDGITEAENEAGEWFGELRFEQYLSSQNIHINVQSLVEHVQYFSGDIQSDDIAVMMVSFCKEH